MGVRLSVLTISILLASTSIAAADLASTIPTDYVYPTDTSIEPGQVYGRVRFKIANPNVRTQESWLKNIADAVFGFKRESEYIAAIQLKDPNKAGDDKLIATQIIAQFVRDKDGTTIFSRKVSDLNRLVLEGEIAKQIPVRDDTNSLQVELLVFKSESRSLRDDALLSKATELTLYSTTLNFLPLDEITKASQIKLRQLALDAYKILIGGERPYGLITETGMSFAALNAKEPFPRRITFHTPYDPDDGIKTDDGGKPVVGEKGNSIAITVDFQTYHSRFASFDENTKKFRRPIWSQYLKEVRIGAQQSNLLQFLLSSSDSIKSFIGGLASREKPQEFKAGGQKVDKHKAPVVCTQIYDLLGANLSSADLAATYWALITQYADQLAAYSDGAECYKKYADALAVFNLPTVSIGATPPAQSPSSEASDRTLKQIEVAAERGTASPAEVQRLLGVVPSQ